MNKAYEYEDTILEVEERPRTSTRRWRPTQAQDIIEQIPATRRATAQPQRMRTINSSGRREERHTEEDEVLQDLLRNRRERRAVQCKQWHPAVHIGAMLFAFALAWMICVHLASFWLLNVADRWNYGPQKSGPALSAVFGHEDSQEHPTRVELINDHGRPVVLEIPGGDGSKAKLYPGPQPALFGLEGNPEQYVMYFEEPRDINGDGRKDLSIIVEAGGFDLSFHRKQTRIVLLNDGKTFKGQGQ